MEEQFLTGQLARHLREMHFGNNFTGPCMKSLLEGIDCELANTKVHDLNTIADLVFHIHYYIRAVIKVFDGGPLDASDKYSYDRAPVTTEAEWQNMLDEVWQNAERLAVQIEGMKDAELYGPFIDGKYGSLFRNLHGLLEHSHYHLGQIALVGKMVRTGL